MVNTCIVLKCQIDMLDLIRPTLKIYLFADPNFFEETFFFYSLSKERHYFKAKLFINRSKTFFQNCPKNITELGVKSWVGR